MKKKVFNTAHRGSKRVKGISREVRVINLQQSCGIDQCVFGTLMLIAKLYKRQDLFYRIFNSLLGFDAHVQNVMTEALALYSAGEYYTLTGIEHVDSVLVNLYREIDRLLTEQEVHH